MNTPKGGAWMRGFSLLEAMVALVIFTMGALALFGWLSSNIVSLQRVEESRERRELVRHGFELLHAVNPMEHPRGSITTGALEVVWESTPLQPPRDSVSQVGLPTLFEVGLYRLQVRVSVEAGPEEEFSLRKIGYRQVRTLDVE
jgi:general secretion pathway protein I